MSKKLLSVVLALALALSCFAVGAFAIGDIGYESEEDAAFYTQAWALSADPTDIGGGKYTVDVYLTANYGVGPIQFQILKDITAGTLTLTDAVAGEAIPQEWEANVAFEDTTGEVIINPDPAEEGAYAIDEPSNAHIATLTFTASADVAATIAINVADAKNAENVGGTLIAARMSDGNVVTGAAITGQTVSQDTNTVTFGNAAPPAQAPELAVIDGTIGVIDTGRTMLDEMEGTECDGYIYGLEPFNYETVDMVFEVVGDGYMNIVANDYGSESGTGTMVQVVDNDDNVVAEYVLIIFGDVDGDGEVTVLDASEVELHAGYAYPDSYGMGRFEKAYTAFAACVDGCGDASTLDSSEIELTAGYAYPDDLGNGYLAQETIIGLL